MYICKHIVGMLEVSNLGIITWNPYYFLEIHLNYLGFYFLCDSYYRSLSWNPYSLVRPMQVAYDFFPALTLSARTRFPLLKFCFHFPLKKLKALNIKYPS